MAPQKGGAQDSERISVRSVQFVRTALLVTLVIGAVSLGQPRAAHAEIIRVAMLPVSVNSSLTETDHLSAGLADMVAARLEQNGQIVIIRLDSPATSREEAIAAGKKAGAEYVLFGSYTQFGDGASLDLRCARVVGGEADEPRRVFVHAGSASEIIPKLGVLSESVARYLVGAAAPPEPLAGAEATAAREPGATSLADIEQRVEALERAILAPPVAAEPAAE
jgi:TolB-like protein